MGCGASKKATGAGLRVDSYRDTSPEVAVNETSGHPSPPVSEEGAPTLTVDPEAPMGRTDKPPPSLGSLEKKHNSLLGDWEKQKLVRQNSVRSASVERDSRTLSRSPSPSFTEVKKPAAPSKKSAPADQLAKRRAGWVD